MAEKTCPICNSSMVLRTALRGKNAGGQFWGCSNFPKCKGLLSLDDSGNLPTDQASQTTTAAASNQRSTEPVHWRDCLPRNDYYSEYVSIGAAPGFAVDQNALQDPGVRRVASQALLLSKRSPPNEVSSHQKAIASIIQKLLTRGTLPLSTLHVEEAIVRTLGLSAHTTSLDERNIEVGWKWSSKPPRGLMREISEAFSYRAEITEEDILALSEDILGDVLDGDNEQYFFSKWLKQTIGKNALHWITPQAELDLILASAGIEQSGQRKIDFLFCHPISGTIAIELDGEDHASKIRSDGARDADLAQAEIKTFRIPNKELELGEGPNLSQLEQALRDAGASSRSDSPAGMPLAIFAASVSARFQFVLARALSSGLLQIESKKWSIGIRTDLVEIEVFQSAADDFAEMVTSLYALYGADPIKLAIKCQPISKASTTHDLRVAAITKESPLTVGLRKLTEDYVFCFSRCRSHGRAHWRSMLAACTVSTKERRMC